MAVAAQSRHSVKANDGEGEVIAVTAWRTDEKKDPIRVENLFLYENGIEQRIKNFAFDPSPSRIAILVDNSQTLQISVEKMKAAVGKALT